MTELREQIEQSIRAQNLFRRGERILVAVSGGVDSMVLLEVLRGLAGADGQGLAGKRPAFEDGRLEELFFRYRARNWPATLDDDEQARWQQHCHDRLHEGLGGGMTIAAFLERIDQLSESADERGQALLGELYDHAEAIAPELD